jgi:hypothetical protein
MNSCEAPERAIADKSVEISLAIGWGGRYTTDITARSVAVIGD